MADHDWRSLGEAIGLTMDKHHIPGAAVAVAQRGKVIYEGAFGLRNLETGDRVTPDTVFGIALHHRGCHRWKAHHLRALYLADAPACGGGRAQHVLRLRDADLPRV